MQIISLFTRVSQSWPESVLVFLRLSSFFNFEFELFSPACAVRISYWAYYRMQMLAPIVFVVVLVIITGMFSIFQRRKRRNQTDWGTNTGPDLFSRGLYMIVFIFSNMYTFLATKVLGPLECYQQHDKTFSMVLSPSSNCFEGEWAQNHYVVILFSILYLGLVPLSIIVVFVLKRKSIWQPEFLWKFGALIRPYKKNLFFWEIVATLKKTAFVVLIKALADITIYARLFYLICFLSVFLGLENMFHPFRTKNLNGLNAYWNILAVFLLMSNAFVFEPQSTKAAGQAIVAAIVVMLMLFALFVSFYRVAANFVTRVRSRGVQTKKNEADLEEEEEDEYVDGAPKLRFNMDVFAADVLVMSPGVRHRPAVNTNGQASPMTAPGIVFNFNTPTTPTVEFTHQNPNGQRNEQLQPGISFHN
jgi:heme/copper-type cytochrome/quinol oxidase subunit 2